MQSRAEQSEAERADRRLQRRLSPLLSLTLRLQVKRGARGHIPGVACERVRAQSRSLPAHTHTNKATWSSKEEPQGDPAENRK